MFCATNTERVIHLPSCGRGEIHHRTTHQRATPNRKHRDNLQSLLNKKKRSQATPHGLVAVCCVGWESVLYREGIIINDGQQQHVIR
jgi:hypothetical protein